MNTTAAAAAAGGARPPFTLSQWQELEHQALIFKYLMAGVPVPPELLLPIRRSFEAMAARFYQSHPTMGYCSFYGKKLDPEPGRCRRTDGKKWRCSKEAYPGSKYCERHMHRGRNRSRKPVETHTLSQTPHSSSSPSPTSSVTSLTLTDGGGGGSGYGGRNAAGSSAGGVPLHSFTNTHNQSACSGANSQLQLDPISYSGIGPKDFRHLQGFRSGVDEHSYFSGASRNEKELGVDSSLDSTWNLMPSGPSSYSLSKYGNDLDLSNNYAQLDSLNDLKQESMTSLASQQNYCGGHFASNVSPKEESQSIRPFLDQWPRTRDSWYDFDKERSHQSSYSTTHLSISIPMASSDFSTTSSRSANDE